MIEPAPMAAYLDWPQDAGRQAPKPLKLWVYEGVLRCAMYPSRLGSCNGYVQLPQSSPDRVLAEAYNAFKTEQLTEEAAAGDPLAAALVRRGSNHGYDILGDIEAHGGLTYGPDEEGWIGFDTGHAWDDWPNETLREILLPDNEDIWLHFREMQLIVGEHMYPAGRMSKGDSWYIAWTLDRLEAAVNDLAAQVYARLKAVGALQ